MAGKRRTGCGPVSIAPSDQRETVSISKISNGYLIERSGVKRGKYYSEQEFSPSKPVVAAAVPASKPKRPSTSPATGAGFLRGR